MPCYTAKRKGVGDMSITAKELAARLGLSEAAVSIALNNRPGVSTATRRRVFEAAREAGYDFSRKALSPNAKRGLICFAIYKKSGAVVDDTPFFSALSEGISLAAKRARYDLIIRYLYEDEDLSDQLYSLKTGGFDGLLLLATEMDEASLRPFESFSMPIVLLDAYFERLSYDCVLINNIQGAYLATSYLISKRKVQPGYLRSSYAIGNFEQRADGFYKAIRAHGMSTSKSLVHRLTPSQEGACADMKALLDAGEKPAAAYFADNDHIAIGAIKALKEAGYRVPEDIAVIGFDDLPVCAYMSPPLTTVEVPKQYLGETAVRRIIERIESADGLPLKTEVSVRLKKRKSV